MSEAAKGRILVVDDDKNLLVTLSDYLSFVGFDVAVAHTAEEALRRIERQAPDLVILDISMPGMGGMGFLKQIRTPEGKCRYPVLVLTARAAMEDFFDNVAVEGFLAKPCSEAALEKKIRDILARRTSAATGPRQRGARILLGEDDDQAAGEIRKALEAAGFSVQVSESGPDVLNRATAVRPDAILLKERLPRMSGSVLVPLIKAMPSTSAVPVILYDAGGRGATAEHPAHAAAPEGVSKLLHTDEPETLLQAVREILA